MSQSKTEVLLSRMKTPDGTILLSRERHEYTTHIDANGKMYMLDGGSAYTRSSTNGDEVYMPITTESLHEEKRKIITWGTYGISGKDKKRDVLIMDLESDHIQAILGTQRLSEGWVNMLNDELAWRACD